MNIAQTIAPARHRLIQQALAGFDFSLASPSDAGEIIDLFHQYFDDEAGYKKRGVVFAADKAKPRLKRAIELGLYPHVVARTSGYHGRIVGVISYSLDDAFSVKPLAVMDMLYVVPEYRRSAVGKILLEIATDMARGDGAVAFHAPIASEIVHVQSVVNLFKKAGFGEIGVIMGKGL
jgi:GNAT superfamily N-acetyltransferase